MSYNRNDGLYLGSFEITSPARLLLIDPKQDMGMPGQVNVEAVRGLWYGYVQYHDDWGSRDGRIVSRLRVRARDHMQAPRKFRNGKTVEVLSGNLSMCDASNHTLLQDRYGEDIEYLVGTSRSAGIVGMHAAVARAGNGTGGTYDVHLEHNAEDKVIAADVVFQYPEDECCNCGVIRRMNEMVGGICQGCLVDDDVVVVE